LRSGQNSKNSLFLVGGPKKHTGEERGNIVTPISNATIRDKHTNGREKKGTKKKKALLSIKEKKEVITRGKLEGVEGGRGIFHQGGG